MNLLEYGRNMTQTPREYNPITYISYLFVNFMWSTIKICSHFRGKIHYTEMYDMLKNMDPPLGFGNKCPNRLAYKKLIRMNMPLDEEGKVNFTTTLFALIRENLNIKMRSGKEDTSYVDSLTIDREIVVTLIFFQITAEEMDQADEELRETINQIWPLQAKKMLDLLVPRNDVLNAGKLTVGKIYAGLLILESWRSTRFGQTAPQGVPVSTQLQPPALYILFKFQAKFLMTRYLRRYI